MTNINFNYYTGHYYNLFLPAVRRGSAAHTFAVGQTAFILQSHILKTSARIMTGEGGQAELEKLLIRPHLSAGDALIFDCRILHLGLANQSNLEQQQSLNFLTTLLDKNEQLDINPKEVDDEGEVNGEIRSMLYINHTQQWFHDPKNWNDREKLFP
jgi:ectoine hydroxylase-related dioxygenase (phytanoyl-CoA dioxygenase family)